MSALIYIGEDCIKLDHSFLFGSLSVSVNGQKLGSWPIRKNTSCQARIGERDYLVTSKKISKGSASVVLKIDINENGNSIHSGTYNKDGVPVASMESVRNLESARMVWCLVFGIIGVLPGALITVRLVSDSGLFMDDVNEGVFVGGVLGAIGGLIGFLVGHHLEGFFQRRARLTQPMQSAHTSALLKNMNDVSSAPTPHLRRLRPAEAEDSTNELAISPEHKTGGNEKTRSELERRPRLLVPGLKPSAEKPTQIEGDADGKPLATISGISTPPPIPGFVSGGVAGQILRKPSDGPSGVGGWLVFFCLCLILLGPLITLWQMLIVWQQSEPAFGRFPTVEIILILANLATSAILIYGFIVGCVILSGSSQGRAIARRFLLTRLFIYIGVEFIAILIAISGKLPLEVVIAGIGGAVGGLFREGVFFTIWWFYFEKSERVHNTYGFD